MRTLREAYSWMSDVTWGGWMEQAERELYRFTKRGQYLSSCQASHPREHAHRSRGVPQNAPRLARGLVPSPRESQHTNKYTEHMHTYAKCDLLGRPVVRW